MDIDLHIELKKEKKFIDELEILCKKYANKNKEGEDFYFEFK